MTDTTSLLLTPNQIAYKHRLLTTKLYRPPAPPNLVPRPRLLNLLDDSLHPGNRLTLISAPPGFGKTTLVSAWLEKAALPVAWVSLDDSDNDAQIFWTYIIAALDGLSAGIGEQAMALLKGNTDLPLESVLVGLINQLATLPKDFILVLDDYHAIENEAIHQVLTFLLDYLPPQMHLIITSRVDPPLPLARLRGYGQLTELLADDLRFTSQETRTFLNQNMGLGLSVSQIQVLAKRTEGWITGLQLAALSIQRRDPAEIQTFVASFTGHNAYIIDYLVEEVFQQQPDDLRHFLRYTAILDRLSGPLCDTVLGVSSDDTATHTQGQAMLENLHHANLFIVPLDDDREWYRYHQLFAEFLRTQLQRDEPDIIPALHRRAAHWYADHDLPPRAIRHALKAEDFNLAANLIAANARAMWQTGELSRPRRWLEALPQSLVLERLELCLVYTWLLVTDNALDEISPYLAQLNVLAKNHQSSPALAGEITAIHAFVAMKRQQSKEAINLLHQALTELPEDNRHIRGLVQYLLGQAHRQRNQMMEAERAYVKAVPINEEAGNVFLCLNTLSSLIAIQATQGKLRQASITYEQALQFATKQTRQAEWGKNILLSRLGNLHRGMGTLLCEWNELEQAEQHLHKAIALLTQATDDRWQLDLAQIALVRVQHGLGDSEGAQDTLKQAEQMALATEDTRLWTKFKARQVWAWLMMGYFDSALHWAETCGLHPNDMSRPDWDTLLIERERDYLALAWVYILQGQAEVLSLLDCLAQSTRHRERQWHLLESLNLKALALYTQRRRQEALQVLNEAFQIAEPEGFVRLFVDKGQMMSKLLHEAKIMRLNPGYVSRLLDAFPTPEGTTILVQETEKSLNEEALTPIDPLSPRELEVLHLIAAGMSNRDIARQLVITEGTVKGHLHRINRKLDTSSRTQAVARARMLRYL